VPWRGKCGHWSSRDHLVRDNLAVLVDRFIFSPPVPTPLQLYEPRKYSLPAPRPVELPKYNEATPFYVSYNIRHLGRPGFRCSC
jgi:hypothetical protein